MRIEGEWHVGDDGIPRPVLRGEAQAADGTWIQVHFLVNSGADRTVFCADDCNELHLATLVSPERLGGVGGVADSVLVSTQIGLVREDGSRVTFRGQFAAFTAPSALDTSVLGRDLLNFFAVIVDRPGNIVCLLGQRHHYLIQQS